MECLSHTRIMLAALLLGGVLMAITYLLDNGAGPDSQTASGPSESGEAVIATVSGDPITRAELERIKENYKRLRGAPATEAALYQTAFEYQLKIIVLQQEARRRGISVSDAAARKVLQRDRELAAQSPEGAALFQDLTGNTGLEGEELEGFLVEGYRNAMVIAGLQETLGRQAPGVTEEEIDRYLTETSNDDVSREQAREELSQVRQAAYIEEYVQQLLQAADIHLYPEHLPPGIELSVPGER